MKTWEKPHERTSASESRCDLLAMLGVRDDSKDDGRQREWTSKQAHETATKRDLGPAILSPTPYDALESTTAKIHN